MSKANQAEIYLGKGFLNRPFSLPYQSLLGKHLLITGQTGSGKSTSAKQIISQLQQVNVTNIVFDPTGEYGRDLENVVTYRLGQNGYIDLRSQSAEEIVSLLGLNWSTELVLKLQAAIYSLRIQATLKAGPGGLYSKVNRSAAEHERDLEGLTVLNQDYDMTLLAKQLQQEFVRPFPDERADYQLLGQELDHPAIQKNWAAIQDLQGQLDDEELNKIFHFHPLENGKTQYELTFILKTFEEKAGSNRSLVIDLPALQDHPKVQKRVLSHLMQRTLQNRLASAVKQPVVLFLDEAHRYIDQTGPINENGLFQLLREGRKHHLNVVIATQSQEDLPKVMRGQCANQFIHRYQSVDELLNMGLSKKEAGKVFDLPVGQALLQVGNKKRFLRIEKPKMM